MHIYEPAPRVKDFQPVSDEVDRLVSQLLSKRPEDRATEIRELAGILAEMAPTEEGKRRSPASAPALVPTVLDDSAATTPRATQPGEMTAPVASALATVPPAGGAPAFVVPASAVPALAAAVPVLRRDKPAPVAFPRPATTLKPGTTPAPAAPSSHSPLPVSSPLQGSAPLPSSPSSPPAGPLAPTLKPSTPAPPQPGGGVAVAVAITVPAAAAAPPPPHSLIPAQQARRRVETPAAWPDGTPTARTTMPPRAFRRSAGPLIAVVLALALFGGSVFAAFQLGAFGGGDREREADKAAEPARPAPQPAPSRVVEREVPAAAPVAADVTPPAPEPEAAPPPAPEAKPEPVEPALAREEAPASPSPARAKKRAKRAPRDKATPSVTSSEDNVIDPFAEPPRRR